MGTPGSEDRRDAPPVHPVGDEDAAVLAAFAALGDMVVLIDAEFRVVWANPAAEAGFARRLSDWQDRSALEIVHPDDVEHALVALGWVVEHESRGLPIEIRLRHGDGHWMRVQTLGSPLELAGGSVVAQIMRDVTTSRLAELSRGDGGLLRELVLHSRELLVHLDRDGCVDSMNLAATRMLQVNISDIRRRHFDRLVSPEHRAEIRSALSEAVRGGLGTAEVHMAVGQAGLRLQLQFVNGTDDPVIGGFVVSGLDVTELRTAQEELRALLARDDLTGTASRTAVLDTLEAAMADGGVVTVGYLDLDEFKPVNDTHGHPVGDSVLRVVGERLRRSTRTGDTVGRLGGDEFLVVLPGTTRAVAGPLLDRLVAVIAEPIHVGEGQMVTIGASVGAVEVDRPSTVEAVLEAADAAMYADKRANA